MEKNKFVYIQEKYKELEKYEVGIVVGENKNNLNVEFVTQLNTVSIPKEKTTYFDPLKTGDAFQKKICNRCNRLLSVDCFDKNQNGKNNRSVRRPSCSECRKIIDGKDVSSSDKRIWNKRKPHMTVWECPICKKKTIPGITSKVVLDHDHTTGKPRAWICDSCNTGLGRFKDDIKTMQDAINYLKQYK